MLSRRLDFRKNNTVGRTLLFVVLTHVLPNILPLRPHLSYLTSP